MTKTRCKRLLIEQLLKIADGRKTITQMSRTVNISYEYGRQLVVQNNIPYLCTKKKLTDVQRHWVRKLSSTNRTVKSIAEEIDATYYAVKNFLISENLPYKSYAKSKQFETEFFCWEMFNFNVY